jgi:hypothetical protein
LPLIFQIVDNSVTELRPLSAAVLLSAVQQELACEGELKGRLSFGGRVNYLTGFHSTDSASCTLTLMFLGVQLGISFDSSRKVLICSLEQVNRTNHNNLFAWS